MKDIPVARRYAKALLSAVSEPSALDGALGDIKNLAALYEESRALKVTLNNPAFSATDKRTALDAVLAEMGAGDKSGSTARLLLESGRIGLLPAIAAELELMVFEKLGRVKVSITSALPLSADEEKDLSGAVGKMTGKKAVISVKTDPSLLGGIVVKIGSSVYDGSVKNQLKALRVSLN
ncbi:MAG: ATP synthase F1 subunit delta [Nitrospinae bacterium]|nr:ATP synthase F1 subunit delta [Nitrospinota bacterium]